MMVTALTLIGYSVGISLISSGIKRKCDLKAAENIATKIANLDEEHTEKEEQDIIKKESLKAVAKYSIATGLVGVAGAAVSTAIICNFDAPKSSAPEISAKDNPDVGIEGENTTTVTVGKINL